MAESLWFDIPKLIAVIKTIGDLGDGFTKSIRMDDELRDAFEEGDDRDPKYDFADPDDPSLTDEEVFDFIGVKTESLLEFGWDSFGPMSWFLDFVLVRDLGGNDLVYIRGDGVSGYPVIWFAPTGDPTLEKKTCEAICQDISSGEHCNPPATILNHRPEMLPLDCLFWALYELVASREGWHDLSESLINDLVYPDHLKKSSGLVGELRLRFEELMSECGDRDEALDRLSADERAEVIEEEKLTLLATFFEQRYTETNN